MLRCGFVLLMCLVGNMLEAAESLAVSFKVRSMYYDVDDKDENPHKLKGTVVNGVPDHDRVKDAQLRIKDSRGRTMKELHGYFGYLDAKEQPKGAACVIVWLETKKGKFVKTLGRWTGNQGYNGKAPGFSVFGDPVYFVQGDYASRIYDMFRFTGAYGRPTGKTWYKSPRAMPVKNIGFTKGQCGISPYDGNTTDYDSVLGPTVGCSVNGKAYLDMDDPRTAEDDASLLTTVPHIPKRPDDKQPKAWDLELAFDLKKGKKGATHLPKGEYNIIIESLEWAMEGEYAGALATKSKPGKNTPASQQFHQQFDHFKVMSFKYDGKSFKLKKGKTSNLDDYYATETVSRVARKKIKGYLNHFTGNKLIVGKNAPAIIYDIKVDYSNKK
ncbi:MAG: hypothetical protein HRU15_18380 [Planctomycetes bacterium]|nr:hypothetical protein [Planctomycetota bacterium]